MQDLQAALLFARTFFAEPKKLGSAIPSSRFLVAAVLESAKLERAHVVVEYGPGVGTITKPLLERLRPDAMLVAIEVEEGLYSHLKGSIHDPRFKVVHGSAADVKSILRQFGARSADTVISGIPFSTIEPDLRERIVASTAEVLNSNGSLVVYQFTAAVLPLLKKYFSRVQQRFVLRNLLPARVFECSDKRVAERAA
jgi:phospholipid N-methyltransferase